MSSTDNEDASDPSFMALPVRLRHRIDDAFDSIVSSGTQSQQPRPEGTAGGFIVEEAESGPPQSAEYESGGFIVEDLPSNSSGAQSYISLSEIHRALNLLDLFADDDIMGVFKNAATGWGAHNARSDGVSRKDWRAVCAALLEGEDVEGNDKEDPLADEAIKFGVDSGSDRDEYQTEELSDNTEDASSDEYDKPARTARKGPTRGSREISKQLTKSQKAQCRQDFSRFFPHVPDNELDHQRIMVKDITRVADLLKEDLETEQVLEMLETFSTSPDKSMNLADFERMMILTKLV